MLKVATYNINGINGRLPLLLQWLKDTKPDIVCLQEIKTPAPVFPSRRLLRRVIPPSGMARKVGMA
ncbi:endonuclease/exonuclease/phosphatase family protein [Chitinophaga sedimenti]|nr:endonuclease/exonuclease/phosphatase family protein [Chitinophaga sedimenti]